MKKLILGVVFILGFQAHANEDLYKCQGQNTRLEIVWDYFGNGVKETVKGQSQGKVISFENDANFFTRKLDPNYEYKFFKDPASTTMVRMVEPDENSVDDATRVGKLMMDGKEIELLCFAPQ